MQHITQQAPAGETVSPFEYASEGPAVPGASRLVSLSYLGTAQIRAYRDLTGVAWFVLADVFRAMGAKYSATLRKTDKYAGTLDQVRVWTVNTVYPAASGYRFIASMSEEGMRLLLGCRPYAAAKDLDRWMDAVALPMLRTA